MMQNQRPLGVAVIAVCIGILGFLLILAGILVLAASALVLTTNFGGLLNIPGLGTGTLISATIVLIFGLIVMALAVALWDLRQWGLALAIIVFGVLFVLDLLSLDWFLLLWGGLVIYLIAVRGHFS